MQITPSQFAWVQDEHFAVWAYCADGVQMVSKHCGLIGTVLGQLVELNLKSCRDQSCVFIKAQPADPLSVQVWFALELLKLVIDWCTTEGTLHACQCQTLTAMGLFFETSERFFEPTYLRVLWALAPC